MFLPYVERQLQFVKRLDFVWDVYKAGSLKSSTRERRGMGEPLRVVASTRLPSNWHNFLRVDSNKTGLFNYLASALKAFHPPEGKVFSHLAKRMLSPTQRVMYHRSRHVHKKKQMTGCFYTQRMHMDRVIAEY